MLKNMKLESLRQKLLATARANPPADRVPYTFEKRIMARLEQQPAFDAAALWARALWRGAAPCIAVALLLSVWSFIGTQNNPTTNPATDTGDLAQHFEQTMLATVTAEEPAEEIW